MSNPTTQLNTPQAKMGALKAALEKSLPNIQAVAARHLTPERLVKIVLGAASRQPLILDCTPVSVVKAVLQAAELGLEPGSSLGEFWLVPYKNGRTGQREAQGIPGYRGLIALARRTGEIANLYAVPVFRGDVFEVEFGLEPMLRHVPNWDSEDRENPAALTFVYAVARFKDGTVQFEVMSRKEVDAIRRRSKASDSGPWVTDYAEMAKKTVIRRLAKSLPMSAEMAKAMELQARAEAGTYDEPVVIDGEVVEAEVTAAGDAKPTPKPATNKGGAAGLKAALQAETAAPPPAEPDPALERPATVGGPGATDEDLPL